MANFEIGDRVTTDKSGPGTIAYFGTTKFAAGIWCGIILDQPNGKNNGTVKEVEYFTCPDKYGVFMKAEMVRLESTSANRRASSIASTPSTSSSNLRALKTPSTTKGMTSSTSSEKLRPSGLKKPSSDPRMTPAPEATASKMKRPSLVATPRNAKKSAPAVSKNSSPTENPPRKEREPEPEKQTPVAEHVREMEKKAELHPEIKPVEFNADLSDSGKIAYLQEQIQELKSKLETLREKRKEDFQKVKEAEQTKFRNEALEQTNCELSRKNTKLQTERDEARKAAQEATSQLQNFQTEYNDFGSLLEEATIDKEIAQENCEQLQMEINNLKQQVEELQTDYEILKTEMETADSSDNAANSVQLKSTQEQNKRLHDGILKMRDALNDVSVKKAEVEQENARLTTLNAEYAAIAEKAGREMARKDETIRALQDQVDAALGSEKMVEALTERNLTLEDTVSRLEEQIEDLESLNTVNEELYEAARAEGRSLNMAIEREVFKHKEFQAVILARENKIAELDKSIEMFRKKVEERDEEILNLNDQILLLNEKMERLAAGQEFGREGITMLSAARTFSDVVAHRTRDIEFEHAQNHVRLLKSFLPDNFTKPGGDNDALLINLVLPRMSEKMALLIDLVGQQYPMVPGGMRREHVTKAHRSEQWVFASHLNYEAKGLITIVKKCHSALQLCSVARLVRIAPMQMEIAAQERTVDCFLELLRTGRLDENVSLDPLTKATSFFQNLFTLNLAGDSYDTNTNMAHVLDQMAAGVVWLKRNLERLVLFQNPSEDASEIKLFVSTLTAETEATEKTALMAKSRVPQADNAHVLNFTSDFLDNVDSAQISLKKFAALVHLLCASAASQMHVQTDVDGLTVAQLKEMIRASAEKGVGQMDEEKAFESFKASAKKVTSAVKVVFDAIDKRDMEVEKPETNGKYPPLIDRAHARKQDAAEAEGLRWQIEKKDTEIMQLKTTVRSKNEDLSTLRLRLELADKKVDNAGKLDDARSQRLQTKNDELMADMARMKTDYERALDLLQKDLDQLEKENVDLKSKSRSISKKVLLASVAQNASQPGSPTVINSIHPLMEKELEQAKDNLKWANHRIRALQSKTTRQLLDEMPELHLPNVIAGVYGLKEKRRDDVDVEIENLKKDLRNVAMESKSLKLQIQPSLPKDKALRNTKIAEHNARCDDITYRIAKLFKKCKPGEKLPAFNAAQYKENINETKVDDILAKWDADIKHGPTVPMVKCS